MIQKIKEHMARLERDVFKDLSLTALLMKDKGAPHIVNFEQRIQRVLDFHEKFGLEVEPLDLDDEQIAWDISQLIEREFTFAFIVSNSLDVNSKNIGYAVGMEINEYHQVTDEWPKIYFTGVYNYSGANKFDIEALFFNPPSIEETVEQVADAYERALKKLSVYKMEKVLEK